MQKTKLLRPAALCAGLLGWSLAQAQASNVFKADVTDALNLASSWSNSIAPTSADIATWDHTVQVNASSVLSAGASWAGIDILDPAQAISITTTNASALTLGASGIDMSLASTSLTIGTPVVLGAAQNWNVDANGTLTLAGAVSGAAGLPLTKTGPGKLILSVANSYAGGTVINNGIVQPSTATSFGTAVVTNNGDTLLLSTFPNNTAMNNGLNFTGTSVIDLNNRNISFLLIGAWSGNGTVIITNDSNSASTFTMGGASGGDWANFTGSVVFLSTNSAGTTSAGTVRFNNGGGNVNKGNANASLDLGTDSLVFFARNRAGDTINFGALIGGPGSSIKIGSSGTGGTTYSIGGKSVPCTFGGIFDGTGTSTANFLALAKVGSSTFTLTGNNTYNGATTISAGTLQIGDGVTSGTGTLGTSNE